MMNAPLKRIMSGILVFLLFGASLQGIDAADRQSEEVPFSEQAARSDELDETAIDTGEEHSRFEVCYRDGSARLGSKAWTLQRGMLLVLRISVRISIRILRMLIREYLWIWSIWVGVIR
jgi:hypothetical protein